MDALGIDVGGTKVAAGVVTPEGQVVHTVRAHTPGRDRSSRAVEDAIVDVARQLAAVHRVSAVGIGAAGFIDAAGSSVAFSPHVAWRNEPLRDALESRLGLSVVVDNDANTAARAEYRFGAARGHRQALCVTLGTGIGGALLVDGLVFRGAHGMAGEFGHMQVVPDGRPCECGNRGCWEQYVSGRSLVRRAGDLIRSSSPAAAAFRGNLGDDPTRLAGQAVTAAARAGDSTATGLLAEAGDWLGTGLANLSAAFDPGVIVVGGGLAEAGDLLLEPARAALRRRLVGRGYRPEPAVVPAALGVDAGLIGAADLARSQAG
ncbi:MAG: Glucokinase [uncultured Nocardioidaceae bacterium]|uniref:Glucokinase n=1 Tax=uncultured Nocardioidaceae bacterium TaxID=253824 RepID=A0A6J4LEK6_9ACTN|nr:MAG: Glucokinase [uncultured Nocardioidaceae bacterium]